MAVTVACRNCPLRQQAGFRQNSAAELDFIEAMKVGHIDVAAGRAIIPQGDAHPHLYTLFAGWAFRFKTLTDGRRQILNLLLPGDLIGFQAELFDAAVHGVEALTDVELCVFSRAKVWELYRNHPELAYDVTWLTAREGAVVDENLVSVGRRSALESVAMLVIHLHKRLKAIGAAQGDSFEMPLTQEHIADALGLSLAHTNKTMRRLQQLGLFQMQGRRLTLRNGRALARLADFYDQPPMRRPLI